MKLFRMFLIACVATVAGCAVSPNAPTFSTAPRPEANPNVAVLYVYRVFAQPTAWSPSIYLDNKEIASVPQEGFTWIYVTPGTRTFKSQWSFLSGAPKVEFPASFKAGQTYYFEISGRAAATGVSNGMVHGYVSSRINESSAEDAAALMSKCCRYIKPEHASY